MARIYLVTNKNNNIPIAAFNRKYVCKNFLEYKKLNDSDVNLFSVREGWVTESKQVNRAFFTEASQ
jgi:hypothetical protein